MNPEFRIIAIACVTAVATVVGTSPAGAAAGSPARASAGCVPASSDLATPDGWAAHVAAHPATTGVVVADGRGHVATHRASTPFPLASAFKVVHLLAYARAVAAGAIRPDEPVRVADWDRWYAGSDGGAHPAALRRLGLTSRGTTTVDALVSAMIRESDNAAADWLRARLGDAALLRAARSVGWRHDGLPSFAGALVRFARPDLVRAGTRGDALRRVEARLGREYATRPAFAAGIRRAVSTQAETDPDAFLRAQLRWADTTASASASDVLAAHRAIATGRVAGAGIARRQLEWQGRQRGLAGVLGFKGGSLPGVLTFGSYLRRDDGTTGYAVILSRALPYDATGKQIVGQQALVLDALTTSAGFDRLRCVA